MFLAYTFWPGYKDDKMTFGREAKAQTVEKKLVMLNSD